MIKHLYKIDGTISDDLIGKSIVIYGCGNDGKKFYELAKNICKIKCFCDSDPKKEGQEMFSLKIIGPHDLGKKDVDAIAICFFKWNEALENIPDSFSENVFADFRYEDESTEKCLICKKANCDYSNAHFAPFLRERMFLGRKIPTNMIHCRTCNFFFSQYRPTDEEMDRLYDKYREEEYVLQRKKYEPNYSAELYYCNIEERKEELTKFLERYIDLGKIQSVLDYGGDQGQFIPAAFCKIKKAVFDISERELLPEIERISSAEELNKRKWDLVTCCHLLEHVSWPLQVLERMINGVSEKGYLYIEVPFESYFKNYSDYEFNEHINFYSLETTETLAKQYDMEIVANEIMGANLKTLLRKKGN